tara:strand:+ start:5858 stop:6595 length:738 start_codon:yes stop_codon:yes gene_type:complete
MLGKAAAEKLIITEELENAKASDKPQFILIHGETGTGKTTSLRTLTSYGRVELFDIDQNSDGLIGEPGVVRHRFQGGINNKDAVEALEYLIRSKIEEFKDDPPAAVVLDSLTTLSLMAMENVLGKSGRQGQMPTLPEYGLQVTMVRRMLLFLGALPVTKCAICIGHSVLESDEASGRHVYNLATTRSLKIVLPRLFGEIYFAHVDGLDDKARYLWRTRKTAQITDARSQLKLAPVIEQDFRKVFE